MKSKDLEKNENTYKHKIVSKYYSVQFKVNLMIKTNCFRTKDLNSSRFHCHIFDFSSCLDRIELTVYCFKNFIQLNSKIIYINNVINDGFLNRNFYIVKANNHGRNKFKKKIKQKF